MAAGSARSEGGGCVGWSAEESGETAVVRGAPTVGDGGGLEEGEIASDHSGKTRYANEQGVRARDGPEKLTADSQNARVRAKPWWPPVTCGGLAEPTAHGAFSAIACAGMVRAARMPASTG